jgi:hypothetical protein
MHYVVFLGALIVGIELFGAPIVTAMPASKSAIVKAGSSQNLIPAMQGCGKHYHRDKSGNCVAD